MADFIRRNVDLNGDFTVNNYVTDKNAILLSVESRLRFFQGEWFLDTEDGTPYFQDIFKKPARLSVIEGIIKRRILNTPGVESLNTFVVTFDKITRKLRIDFEAFDQFDNVISSSVSI